MNKVNLNLNAAGNVFGNWAKTSTGLALLFFVLGLLCKVGADKTKK